jgi:hypothetical protein
MLRTTGHLSKANFKIFPKLLPKHTRSFSISEKLAQYDSSALSGVEDLTLLVGKSLTGLESGRNHLARN